MNFEKKWGMKPMQMQAWREQGPVGRVVKSSHGIYTIVTREGLVQSKVTGRFEYNAMGTESFPAVGDWCLLDEGQRVVEVLPRSSCLMRKVAGNRHDLQVIASNIDVLFICMSLNEDFNIRRLERYLTIGGESGAEIVVLLTKADLTNAAPYVQQVQKLGGRFEVIPVSLVSGMGLEAFQQWALPESTCAFVGSSGVGKSSLMNYLIGEEAFDIGGLRNDGKGRHTTTHRELRMLEDGLLLIDTPGMREIQLGDTADMDTAFADIESLAVQCKFNDCTHVNEPGCAVWEAIESGEIEEARLRSWEKMKREAAIAARKQKRKERRAQKQMKRNKKNRLA